LEIVAFDTTADWGLGLIIAARACFFLPFLLHVFSALFSLSFFCTVLGGSQELEDRGV